MTRIGTKEVTRVAISIFRRGKKVLIKINRRKFVIHFSDGSVKHIGAP